MISTLLRVVGIDINDWRGKPQSPRARHRRRFRGDSGARPLGRSDSFWLELKLGIFAALSILGGTSALLAIVLLAIAFRRTLGKPRAHAKDTLRAAADPVQASASSIARAADEAVKGAADMVRNGSRQQIAGTIAVAALIGWLLGAPILGPRRSHPAKAGWAFTPQESGQMQPAAEHGRR